MRKSFAPNLLCNLYKWQQKLSRHDHNVANLISKQLKHGCPMLQLGSTAIGVKTKEGVVLSVEKRVTSTLLVTITFQGTACTLQSCSAYDLGCLLTLSD